MSLFSTLASKIRGVWAVLVAWWRFFLAGPAAIATPHYYAGGLTTSEVEAAVERACKRALEAGRARRIDTSQVRILFMDEHERELHGERIIPAYARRPNLTLNGFTYVASRVDPSGAWVYRETA